MDYEKLYKEALERARNLHKDAIDMDENICAKQCEIIFPELAESKDERIRKALLRFHASTIDIDGIQGKEILAWLEKQSEQKPVEEYNITGIRSKHADGKLGEMIKNMESANKVEQKDYSSIDPHFFKPADKIEKQPSQWNISDYRTWQYIVSDVLTKHDGIGQYLDDDECKKIAKYMQEEWSKRLSVEQRTTELPKGEDYGIDGLYAAIDILQKTLGEVDGYQSDDGILEHECAISAVKELSKQQKPAWSEEDKRSLQGIIDEIQANKNNAPDYDLATYDRFLSWLKSLRPQNRWKPSDEQIAVIEAVINNRSFQRRHLDSLYADLKKLKE